MIARYQPTVIVGNRESCCLTTGLSRFVPSVCRARKGQTMTLYGSVESAATVESEFCSNPNVMLLAIAVDRRKCMWLRQPVARTAEAHS